MELQTIQQKIFEIRGQKMIMDFDLAALYEVETKVLNQAVKRNVDRFPIDFMFRISREEYNSLRSRFVTLENGRGKYSKYNPYVFTEHGVTMLASVLRSDTAVKMNIAIVRAFIALRKFAIQYKDVLEQLDGLREKIGGHDEQLNQIYEALKNMLDKKVNEEMREEARKNRKRIGFKN